MAHSGRPYDPAPARLGLWDAASIIVGIIVGVGIFEIPSDIFQAVPGPWQALVVWLAGGIFALTGAMCFAELASAYPRSGGEYVYLTNSFGSLVGFLFAWAQLAVIRPGSIGVLAYVFATYADRIWELPSYGQLGLAVLSVAGLTAINILGVTLGAYTQNLLTVLKVLGVATIAVVGLGVSSPAAFDAAPNEVGRGWFATAMILVLWTYAGWHEAAYIAAEVKDGRRNIPRALILGTLAVTIIYLLVNLAYLLGLGFVEAKRSGIAANLLEQVWPVGGVSAISVLIMISALGAINGMIFTTARIYSEFGADHRLFRPLSHWSKTWGTPARALVVQGVISVAMIVGVALVADVRLARINLDAMISVTAAVFWAFFFLTGVALFVLRRIDPETPRPFRVPLYPVLPLLFCAACGYMVYGSILYKPWHSLIGVAILAVGLPFYFIPKKRRYVPAPAPEPEPLSSGRV